ncbi:unnamed protein product [Acanthosepion pharaonis]|uniref:Uncharacterized protein n=1 Tax=Acanthosepion pharaonis TaxID=158019 RepID=A0A812BPI5_ACAPH|nr:unnamed protein product [Sepia pharaonis]
MYIHIIQKKCAAKNNYYYLKICADEEEDNNYHYANTQSILYWIATTIFSLLKILDENEDVIRQHNPKKRCLRMDMISEQCELYKTAPHIGIQILPNRLNGDFLSRHLQVNLKLYYKKRIISCIKIQQLFFLQGLATVPCSYLIPLLYLVY